MVAGETDICVTDGKAGDGKVGARLWLGGVGGIAIWCCRSRSSFMLMSSFEIRLGVFMGAE